MTLTYVYWGVIGAAGLALLLLRLMMQRRAAEHLQKQKDKATQAWRNAVSIDME